MALLGTLTEDFSGTPADRWYTNGLTSFTGGTATVSVVGAVTSQVFSKGAYEFARAGSVEKNTQITARVTLDSNAATLSTVETGLSVYEENGSGRIMIYVSNGTLCRRRVTSTGTVSNVGILTYNAATMAYWRLKAAGGYVFIGTSPDGIVWTDWEQVSFAPATNTAMHAELHVKGTNGTVPMTSAVFDDINITPTIANLTDTFDGSTVDAAKWTTPITGTGSVTVADGKARLSTTGASSFANLLSATSRVAYGSSVYMRVVPDPVTLKPPVTTHLQVFKDTANYVTLYYVASSGMMHASNVVNSTATWYNDVGTYDPVQWAYWRITIDGAGYPFFARSADGVTWTDVAYSSAASSFASTSAQIRIRAAGATGTNVALIDSVNVVEAAAVVLGPGSVIDAETLGAPGVAWSTTAQPGSLADPEALGAPQLAEGQSVAPGALADAEQLGAPSLGGAVLPSASHPGGLSDPDELGAPTLTFTGTSSLLYGAGTYGLGVYNGQDQPADPGDSTVSNVNYGAGTYGDGNYHGNADAPEAPQVDNPDYGVGTYGYGTYRGTSVAPAPDPDTGEALPLFPQPTRQARTALHLLAIGPWNPIVDWRGAANYGVRRGKLPARPTLSLPNAQTKSFTLRLNDADEARLELALSRRDAIVVDEMVTDLWWRRKDPYTGILEMIGRFNTSHVDIARTDTGLSLSCQFEDYRQILGDRLILRYLHPTLDPPTTMWDKGTKVTDVLAWALPKNTGIDLSEVTGAYPVDLGTLTQPFHLPLGTTIDDMMTNLVAVSPKPWEWWVETPANVNAFPKLTFAVGQRGVDKGVTLFDYGTGPTPIASWTRRAASDQYANSLYYSGGTGGVAIAYDAQILEYGQRDFQDGNASLKGDIKAIRAAADQRLRELADRRPTFAVTVKPGWWRGRAHVDVGDTVGIEILLGRELLRESYRVSEIQCDIDANGVENVTFTFGNPLPSSNPRSKKSPLARLVRKLKNYETPPGANDIGLPDEEPVVHLPEEPDAVYVAP